MESLLDTPQSTTETVDFAWRLVYESISLSGYTQDYTDADAVMYCLGFFHAEWREFYPLYDALLDAYNEMKEDSCILTTA